MDRIIIIGTGETAELAFDYFTNDSKYRVDAFAVQKEYKDSDKFLGLPVVELSDIESKYSPTEYGVFVAISYTKLNRVRSKLYNIVKEKGYELVSYISSRAFVARNVNIGRNCFILENNVLQYGTTIEDNVVLWSGNHIGHRTIIRENCYISSHVVISGFCDIGRNCFVGVNASFANNIIIADDCLIGMGAVVNKGTEKGKVYVGNPAKPHKFSAYKLQSVEQEEL